MSSTKEFSYAQKMRPRSLAQSQEERQHQAKIRARRIARCLLTPPFTMKPLLCHGYVDKMSSPTNGVIKGVLGDGAPVQKHNQDGRSTLLGDSAPPSELEAKKPGSSHRQQVLHEANPTSDHEISLVCAEPQDAPPRTC